MTKRQPWWKPRRSRRTQRWALLVVAVSLLLFTLVLAKAYHAISGYPDRPGEGSSDPIALVIEPGTTFPEVLDMLVQHGVISEDEKQIFRLYVLHKGADRKTTAGAHTFRGDMTPTEILEELARQQKAEEVKVTVPEGRNILEVAAILAEAGLADAATLEAAMRDRALLDKLGISGETAEGYLFPDTYKFRRDASAEEIVERMVKRHRQVFDDLRRRHRDGFKKLEDTLDWGDEEVVILASIVEKETGVGRERPLIAGVFLNRLRFPNFQPKLLQTDPTIIYGCTVPEEKSEACKQFEGRIRTMHLRDKDNRYSTYANTGLPPGPISNPGRAALEAVLEPTKSRYLFFVARNDGTHEFSKSEAEHEKWVDLYQRKGVVGKVAGSGE